MELLTGFLIGLAGSLHCIGMCGPVILALPKSRSMFLSRLLYNLGRIVTYSMLGLLFGLLGSRLEMLGLQKIISISLGILILISAIIPLRKRMNLSDKLGLYKLVGMLKAGLGKLFQQNSMASIFGIGLLNGLLPCGAVYIGVTGSIAISNPFEGMAFMAMFGIGTLPVMLAASMLGSFITINVRQKLRRLVPALTIVIAAMFILRGLNLGVPYVSPKIESRQNVTEQVICH